MNQPDPTFFSCSSLTSLLDYYPFRSISRCGGDNRIHYVLPGETRSCLTLATTSTCVALSPMLPFAVAPSLVLPALSSPINSYSRSLTSRNSSTISRMQETANCLQQVLYKGVSNPISLAAKTRKKRAVAKMRSSTAASICPIMACAGLLRLDACAFTCI